MEPEQADGGGHRQLEEVGGADQCGWARDVVLLAELAVEPVGQAGIQHHLDQDRHREHRDHQRLLDDGLALECEQEHERQQQRRNRPRSNAMHGALEGHGPALEQLLA
ncbi:hypothetical protein D3C72_2065790 [compost metagenome]